MSVNWAALYGNNPIAQILGDISPTQFTQLMTEPLLQQLTSLKAQAQLYTAQQNAWTTLQGDARAVSNDLATLALPSTFQQLTATSSNTNVATASDSSAQAGSYNITVTQLATAEIDQGSSSTTGALAVTNPTTALGLTGSFTVGLGSGASASITVSSSDSLNQIAAAINNAKAGVTATTEQQSNGDWILALQGNSTGQGQTINLTDTAGSSTYGPLYYLGLYNDPAAAKFSGEVVQQAADASLYFGTNSSSPITSTTNTFTNAIPGVTLSVTGLGSTSITVGANVPAMTQSVQTLVNDWNTWVTDSENLAMSTVAGNATSSTSATGGTTSGYQTNPNQVLSSPVPMEIINQMQTLLGGWTGNSGPYQSLADLGITYNANNTGTLTINTSVLQHALTANPAAVGQVFQTLAQKVSSLLNGFYMGANSTTASSIAYDQNQEAMANNQVALAQANLKAAEQQAVLEYGQWVKAISALANESSMINATFGQPNKPSGSGGA